MAYEIRFSASAEEHFARLSAGQRSIIAGAVRTQLLHEPLREARNRKPLRPTPLAPWELRAGPLRIFCEVLTEHELVNILAIRIKAGNRLSIAGQEINI